MRRSALLLLATALSASVTLPAHAANVDAASDCVAMAARYHGVNDGVLRAILWDESRMNPLAVGHNANGTVDVGIAQMNSVHFEDLRRHGVTPQMLYDPCVGSYVAAWHLRRQMVELGNTWSAIGAYHSRSPQLNHAYANEVAMTMAGWGLLPRDFIPFPDAPRMSAQAQHATPRGGTSSSNPTAPRATRRQGIVAISDQ